MWWGRPEGRCDARSVWHTPSAGRALQVRVFQRPAGTLPSSLRNDRTWERVTPAVATRAVGGVSPASTAAGLASGCVARATGRASQGPTNIEKCTVCAAADEAGGAARSAVAAGPIVRHAAAPGASRSRLPTRRSTTTSGDPPSLATQAMARQALAPSHLFPLTFNRRWCYLSRTVCARKITV